MSPVSRPADQTSAQCNLAERKRAEFHLRRSRYYLFARLLLAAATAVLVIALPLQFWAFGLGLVAVAVAACWFIFDFVRHRPESLIVLDARQDSWQWISGFGDGKQKVLDLELAPSQFVTRHLVIVYFRRQKHQPGRRMARIIPSDSLSRQQHRLLRMLLIERAKRCQQ